MTQYVECLRPFSVFPARICASMKCAAGDGGQPESFQFRRRRMGIYRRVQYMMDVRQKIRSPDAALAEIESWTIFLVDRRWLIGPVDNVRNRPRQASQPVL